ncbi:serine/threonine-protein phosphatase [bacterium]|nr:MAG: serine/threonine-protein phosphatase [bacterium]
MSNENSTKKNDPGIFNTIRHDVQSGGHFDNIRREYRELRDFYIDTEKKSRLVEMNVIKRWIFFVWWLLKSMFFKLTPTRRLLLLLGIFFTNAGFAIQLGNARINDNNLLGGILILFVLLLELKDKLLAHSELESGRKVQQALAPERCPQVSGWSLWLYTRPANEVGGDLVDFLRISPERAGLIMADVAGKGLRAALLTAKLQATVRALASDHDSLSAFCSKVNAIFHRDSLPSIFASLLYIEIKPEENQIRFVNAGHMPPLVISAQGVKELSRGELALGLSNKTDYSEQTIELQRGEVLFAYSDGLTEGCNEAGEFYGTERLTKLLSQIGHFDAQHIGETVTNQLGRFVGDARANDDLSLLIVKRL